MTKAAPPETISDSPGSPRLIQKAVNFAAIKRAILDRFETEQPTLARHFRLGPMHLVIETPGDASRQEIYDQLLDRLNHARTKADVAACDAQGTLRVKLIDLDGRLPDVLADFAATLPQNSDLIYLKEGEKNLAVLQPDSGSLDILDLRTGEALCCIAYRDRMPGWHWATPLRHLIGWHNIHSSAFIGHGAGLAIPAADGRPAGLFLTGESGAGKSTLTTWAVRSGIQSVGDDIVLIAPSRGQSPIGYALYNNVKIGRPIRENLGNIAGLNWRDADTKEKRMVALDELMPGALLPSLRFDAIIVPRVSGHCETSFSQANMATAVRALAPSTMAGFRGGERETYPKIATFVRQLPVYQMATGTDPEGALAALRQIAAEVR